MKKIGYLLSLLLHAALLLAILAAEFHVVIRPEPPRVITVLVAEPPAPFIGPMPAAAPPRPAARTAPARAGGRNVRAAGAPSLPRLSGPTAQVFSLKRPLPGTFRLGPSGKSPEPWELPLAAASPPGSLRYRLDGRPPGASAGGLPGAGPSHAEFLLPFDTRERVVADWTDAAMARIERNWVIPASARLAFSGLVQVTLTIERGGGRRSLVIDNADVPETLIRAALHAVEASLPLPPLPGNVAGESFTFTFVFRYNG
jgi:outer membrane biosynthesis protein TonB